MKSLLLYKNKMCRRMPDPKDVSKMW